MTDTLGNTIHDKTIVKNFRNQRDKIGLTADVEGAGKRHIHG